MRVAIICLGLIFAEAATANAQTPHPWDQFEGQVLNETTCEPAGSTRTMSACAALWRMHEEGLLQETVDRLTAYARGQESRSPIYRGERGYVGSIGSAQDGWLEWRNRECEVMTLSDVGGTIRSLSYPNCQARLTALRTARLEGILALWRMEFRDAEGEWRDVECVLEPALDYCTR